MSDDVKRLYRLDKREGRVHRESYIYWTPKGAIEGWRCPISESLPSLREGSHYGGIELHSPTPLFKGQSFGRGCPWVGGGDCYHDGSSLAFDDIKYLFDSESENFMWDTLGSYYLRWVEEDG